MQSHHVRIKLEIIARVIEIPIDGGGIIARTKQIPPHEYKNVIASNRFYITDASGTTMLSQPLSDEPQCLYHQLAQLLLNIHGP
jgi:hypothetical protein